MSPKPSRLTSGAPARLAIVATLALFALAAKSGKGWLLAAAGGGVGLLTASACWTRLSGMCSLTVRPPTDLVVGEPARVGFVIGNPSTRPCGPVVARYRLDPLAPPAVAYADAIPAGGQIELLATFTPHRRGEADAAQWEVEKLGPFGLFSRRAAGALPAAALVAPARANPVSLRVGVADDGGVRRATMVAGHGPDVRGVREWRPGDGAARVHWRSTARTGQLRVLEREDPGRPGLGLLVSGVSDDPWFEGLLSIGAATVGKALAEGARCLTWTPGAGAGRVEELTGESFLEPFVRAKEPAWPPPEALAQLVGGLAPAGTLLVVASPLPATWRASLAAAAGDISVVHLSDVVQPTLGDERVGQSR